MKVMIMGEAGIAEAPVELRPAERTRMDARTGLLRQGWLMAKMVMP
ncbi:MAG: hypothetical protein ACRESS_00275 [Stenotrophobium sp.]